MMKKIISFAVAFLISAIGFAQTPEEALDNFIGNVAVHRTVFEYKFVMEPSVKDSPKVVGEGKVIIQDNCWCVEGMGVDMHCDGKSTWIVDPVSEEIIIENAEDSEAAMNPVTMISAFDESFERKSLTIEKQFVKAVLEPKTKSDIVSVTVLIARDGSSLHGASVKMKDGTVTYFTVPSFAFKGKTQDMSVFSFDEKSVSKDYVVTDLR